MDLLTRAKPLVRDSSPFADLGRRGTVVWLDPVLVAEVTYQAIVQGRLQAAVLWAIRA